MGLLARLFRAEKRDVVPVGAPVSDAWAMRQIFGFDATADAAGQAVTERCRSLISQTTASVPLVIYRRTGTDGSEEAREHPLWRVLNDEASDGVSSFTLREAMARDCATYGNALAQIVRNNRGEVDEIIYWPWGMVAVERLASGLPRYRATDHLGRVRVLLRGEVIHLRYATRDGVIGVAPLEWARTSTALVAAQAGLAREQTERGFTGDLVFEMAGTFQGELADSAFKRLKDQLAAGARRMRRGDPLLLEGGLEAKSVSENGRDAQFHESRITGLEDIARAYSVPLSVVGLGRNPSYGSLTEESRSLLRDCLGPWAKRIEDSLAVACLSPEERRTYRLEHDLSGLQRGDMQARFTAYKAGVDAGWLAPNEARVWEGLNRLPDGDQPLTPTNRQPSAAPD